MAIDRGLYAAPVGIEDEAEKMGISESALEIDI